MRNEINWNFIRLWAKFEKNWHQKKWNVRSWTSRCDEFKTINISKLKLHKFNENINVEFFALINYAFIKIIFDVWITKITTLFSIVIHRIRNAFWMILSSKKILNLTKIYDRYASTNILMNSRFTFFIFDGDDDKNWYLFLTYCVCRHFNCNLSIKKIIFILIVMFWSHLYHTKVLMYVIYDFDWKLLFFDNDHNSTTKLIIMICWSILHCIFHRDVMKKNILSKKNINEKFINDFFKQTCVYVFWIKMKLRLCEFLKTQATNINDQIQRFMSTKIHNIRAKMSFLSFLISYFVVFVTFSKNAYFELWKFIKKFFETIINSKSSNHFFVIDLRQNISSINYLCMLFWQRQSMWFAIQK